MINLIIVGVFSWATLFFLIRKIFPNNSYMFCNRLVSTIHATLAVTLSVISVQDWSCPLCPIASKSTPRQMQALAITVGYFIYDLVCSHFDKTSQHLDNTVHHLVCIVAVVAGLAYQKCGSEMVATLFIGEISTPFLHLREILKELGYTDTGFKFAADVLFAVIFSVARMVCGPCVVYVTVTSDNPLIIKAMASGLQLVSVFWFYRILKMVKHKFTKLAIVKKSA